MTETASRIYLVRHAQTVASHANRCRGRTDLPLDREGQRQAARLATTSTDAGITAVYSSGSGRALATARPIASTVGCQVIVDNGLAELDFGAFEGRPFAEIAQASPAIYRRWMASPTTVRFPGGESFAMMKARTLSAVSALRLRHPGATVVAVSHSGPIRSLLGAILGIPDRAVFRLVIDPASVSIVEWIGDHARVAGVNLPAFRPVPSGTVVKMHGDAGSAA